MGGVTPAKADGVISGWYLTCNVKGYNIFCLNFNEATNSVAGKPETYCLYVDND